MSHLGTHALYFLPIQLYAEGSNDLPKDYAMAKNYFQRAVDMVCTYVLTFCNCRSKKFNGKKVMCRAYLGIRM